MDISNYMKRPGEQPLDSILPDGGLAAIFRTIACVGDSLSSGEMEVLTENAGRGYYDMFEYSWGQFMARMLGCKAYNFSRGGMTAEEYMTSWAENNCCWDRSKAAQAYIVAMGVNDITRTIAGTSVWGDIDDVKPDWRDNGKSVTGYYAAMLQRYKEIQPDAKFFLMTIPRGEGKPDARTELEEKQRDMLYALADKFTNTYVLDFHKYAPVYGAEFYRNFMLNGHMNPAGYLLTAKMTASYIDYIIRNNPADFSEIALIGTGIKNYK